MDGVAPRRRGVALLVATVAVAGAAFLVAVAPWARADPGYSLDGFNASVWGLGARAAADDPVASRGGGVQPDGDRYANHPPLTVWAAATGDWLSGGRSWAVRAPAVLASLLALAVLAVLLREAGLRPGAAAAGVAVAATTGMFLTYGAMLDTPVVSLPFGLLALVVAQRSWQGRPPPVPVLMGAGALAALSGWQAALVATLAAATCALGLTDPPTRARRAAISLLAGVGLGAGITIAWIGWVHTSVGPLFDQAGFRAGGRGTDAPWTSAVAEHLADLYGPAPVLVLLAVALVVALVVRPAPRPGTESGDTPVGGTPVGGTPVGDAGLGDAVVGPAAPESAPEPRALPWWRPRGLRPVAAVLGVGVVGYTLVFRNGAAVHDYWTYWGIALVAVGVAAVTQVALDAAERSSRAAVRRGGPVAIALVVGAAAVTGTVHQSTAETRIREGLDLLPILEQVPDAPRPTAAAMAVYGAPGELPWADIATRGRAVQADDVAALRQLPPDLPVLVVLRRPPSPALRQRATASNDRFVLLPASDLLDHLDG